MAGDDSLSAVAIWDVGPNGDAEWANLPSAPPGDGRSHRPAITCRDRGQGLGQFGEPAATLDGRLVGPSRGPSGCCAMNIEMSSDGATIAIGYWKGT